MENAPKDHRTAETGAGVAPGVFSAAIFCDNCGRTTPHRILRLDRRGTAVPARVSGVARCKDCRFTHPFSSVPEDRVELALIVSTGARSTPSRVALPRGRKLQVGSGVPESKAPLTIQRIEDLQRRSITNGLAGEITTVWAIHDEGAVVLVSVVEGRQTRSIRWPLPHGTVLRVGDELPVESQTVRIVGLRARGHTWRRDGDEFSAEDVTRVYGRRTSSPPAGNSPWSRVRVKPSSRARSTSTVSRSRSTPGTRTTRTVPRARIDAGGAAVQRVSP
jgi:uncharacterized Zn finger protein